jgi:very-short-patch-repair endonuclease
MASDRARELRKNMTYAERLLWGRLRAKRLGVKFRRQAPLGAFIADFCSHEVGLVVELDGGQHNRRAHYDSARTAALEAEGWRVLRFWNNDVLAHTNAVEGEIRGAVETAKLERGAVFGAADPHAPLPKLRRDEGWLARR